MKVKFLWMYLVALVGVLGFTSCSDDDDSAPAVGITSITVTPEGSAVGYSATFAGFNATVGIPANVFSLETLTNATVEATATMGTEVFYNGEAVGEGIVIDLTKPVVLVAKGSGIENSYTLTVSPAEVTYGDMALKSTKFISFPQGLVDYDVTFFNDKFYAITTAVTGAGSEEDPIIEHYQLFSSEDAINWTEVEYTTSTEGVVLPEGQDGYVVGGEGARLVVFNDRMFVLGGARTKGADIYGNAAEVDDWGFMVMTNINAWRSFSTADGVNFECDTVATTYTRDETVIPTSESAALLAASYLNAVEFKGELYIQGGFYPSFGMWQGARRYAKSVDGKNWTAVTPVGTGEDASTDVNLRIGNAFFVHNNKMWCVGGYTNWPSASNMKNSVWSSEDGVNWTMETEAPNGVGNITGMKVLSIGEYAYMFGGVVYGAEESVISNKIYRSTDCVNWEEVTTPDAFTARRNIVGVAEGNNAWLFGDVTSPFADTYGYPVSDTDEKATDTWVKTLN
ncbi:MAG: hypothetical protein J6R36_04935 [Bacteroidaceae bacterium]|nr:hypothetical protein [Bacteroidaceae bacterium]